MKAMVAVGLRGGKNERRRRAESIKSWSAGGMQMQRVKHTPECIFPSKRLSEHYICVNTVDVNNLWRDVLHFRVH